MWLFKKNIDPAKWDIMNEEVLGLTKENKLNEALISGKGLLKFSKRHYGRYHKNTVTALNNLGIICMMKKDYEESESYLLASLQVSEKTGGRYNKEVAVVNMNLAKLYAAKAREINDIIMTYQEAGINDRQQRGNSEIFPSFQKRD